MTFLLPLLLVVSVIYWTSLLIAELVLTSPSEQRLAVPVRVGMGYVAVVVYFAAAFKLLPIQIAWVLGSVLLVAFLLGRRPGFLADRWQTARTSWRSFVGWYGVCLLLTNVFLLPLHLTRTYGPFTEGGGDVTIYADVAKYLVDNGRPAFGPDAVLYGFRGVWRNIEAVRQLKVPGDNLESLAQFDLDAGNPPHAEYASYNVSNLARYSSLQFSPTAQWFPFFGQTDYPVFYGVMAFQYALLVLGMACAASYFGRLPAVIAFSLGVASQGLVSVPFNMYFLQLLCLMMVGLVLSALPRVPLFSRAGVRTYGLPVAAVASGYLHFASVLVPLLAARPFFPSVIKPDARHATDISPVAPPKSASRLILNASGVVVATVLFAMWLLADGANATYAYIRPFVYLFIGLSSLVSGSTASLPQGAFFGDAISTLSDQWRSFFFGILSQQHYPPFAELPARVAGIVSLGNLVGVALLLFGTGLLIAAGIVARRQHVDIAARDKLRVGLALYAVSLLVIGLHVAITQSTLYIQAKGAQDVLVVLYVGVLAIPAMLAAWRGPALLRWAGRCYFALASIFVLLLAAPRAYFAWDLANGRDRGTIIESSYFAEAARIRQVDPSPFVLMEPEVNSDIYLTIQPFFGARMLPTRHLSLQRTASVTRNGEGVDVTVDRGLFALDFVQPNDLQHLWTLEANTTRHPDAHFPMAERDRVWNASRVAETTRPLLLLAGNYYERSFTQKPRSSSEGDVGSFTYLRGGSAGLVLPAGPPASHSVSLRIQAEDPKQLASLAAEIGSWLDNTAFAKHGPLTQDGSNLSLTYHLMSDATPRLVPLVRASATYLLNVRIDDREINYYGVEVSTPSDVRPGEALQVAWRGLEQPASDDWLAVFPVGGTDATRVTWQPTGGAAAGTLSLRLPEALPPGPYEVRLYAHGTWNFIAATKFDVPP